MQSSSIYKTYLLLVTIFIFPLLVVNANAPRRCGDVANAEIITYLGNIASKLEIHHLIQNSDEFSDVRDSICWMCGKLENLEEYHFRLANVYLQRLLERHPHAKANNPCAFRRVAFTLLYIAYNFASDYAINCRDLAYLIEAPIDQTRTVVMQTLSYLDYNLFPPKIL